MQHRWDKSVGKMSSMRGTDRNRAESHPNTSKKPKEEEYSYLKKNPSFIWHFSEVNQILILILISDVAMRK